MRQTPEWIGETDDTQPPLRVRVRVLDRYGGRCQCGCNRKIATGLFKWDLDHRIALINGGQNRESNLQPLLHRCHKIKTRADVAEKSKIYKKRLVSLGLEPHWSDVLFDKILYTLVKLLTRRGRKLRRRLALIAVLLFCLSVGFLYQAQAVRSVAFAPLPHIPARHVP